MTRRELLLSVITAAGLGRVPARHARIVPEDVARWFNVPMKLIDYPTARLPIVFGVLAPDMMPKPPYYRAHDRFDEHGHQWMKWDDWQSAYRFELVDR